MRQKLPDVALDTAAKIVGPALITLLDQLLHIMGPEDCAKWLHTPNTQFNGRSPMELCLTGSTSEVYEHVIDQIAAETEENVSGVRGVPLNDDERFQ